MCGRKAAPGLSDSNNTYNLTREVGRAVAAILAMGEDKGEDSALRRRLTFRLCRSQSPGSKKAAPGLSDSNNTYNLTREAGQAVAVSLAI